MLHKEEQMSLFGQDTWSGKTSPEPSQATEAKTSPQSSKKRSGSQSRKPPLFLCLTKDGPQADASLMWTDGGALRGEYSMHSFGESPKDVVESRLSQILEDSPHPKYSLSAKACQGILNRANRRGKKLPEPLEKALVKQSLALSKSEEAVVGGGKGALVQEDKSATLSTLQDQTLFQPIGFAYKAGAKAGSVAAEKEMGPTLLAGRSDAAVFDARGNGDGRIAPTMTGDHQNRVTDYTSILLDDQGGSQISVREDGKSCTLRAETHGNIPCVLEEAVCLDVGFFNLYQECSPTLLARGYKDPHLINGPKQKARRLTPLECERLQGYPDGWTDIGEWVDSKGKKHKEADSPRYKALGNSIALPNWVWILKRISAVYERTPTMASLFDGIGGFPLIWERINGKGTCLWASEIEEFPMAVTKVRFGDGYHGA